MEGGDADDDREGEEELKIEEDVESLSLSPTDEPGLLPWQSKSRQEARSKSKDGRD